MKDIVAKIMTIYPELTPQDFDGVIALQNDGDEKGDYIRAWNHPTLPEPAVAQLVAIV